MKKAENRFARHPVATVLVATATAMVICLLVLELFLKIFSGLGNPPLYELSPLFGYRLKANQTIEPPGGMGFLYGARLTTNNLGLRAAEEWDENPKGKILFLGDSVTYGGQYVGDEHLFTSVVKERLSGWQVGNGGVNAWGVENIVGLLKGYGLSPAEVVVTCLIEGDFYRGLTRAASMPLWTERPRFALQHLLMHLMWQINRTRYGGQVNKVPESEVHRDKIVERAVGRLKSLNRKLKQEQVKHIIFILPTRSQVLDGEQPDERVRRFLRENEVAVEDLLPALQALEPDRGARRAWFHDEVHLEVAGHQVYGNLIGERLAKLLMQ